ncbi:MAG: sensor histidine kinase, partial [Methanobacteriota archaeon]
LRMILNLLDISRLEQQSMELTPTPIDLATVITDMIEYFQELPQNENKQVSVKISSKLPKAFIDKEMLERVLDNLLHYVFFNTPDHANVLIEVEKAVSDFLLLKIYHEGRYIPEKYQDKIFSKYAQLELKEAGFKPARGLGLIFCRMAIEASGGIIQIDPEFKHGTGFIMKIPIWKPSMRKKSEIKDATNTN